MRNYLVAAAMVTGPFSGVDMATLMQTPILARETVFTADGEALAQLGRGLTAEGRGEKTVAVTGAEFALDLAVDLTAGRYTLQVTAEAPGRGADSFWVLLDGERQSQPLPLPVGVAAERSAGLLIRTPGRHLIGLRLREAPGCAIHRLELSRQSIKARRPPLRADLASQHPRLLLTANDRAKLRARLATPQGQKYYRLPDPLTRKPPPFKPGARNGGAYRDLGAYALAHLLSPDPKQLAAVCDWLDAATVYPHCGVDLDAEYFMEGVALSYDWLHDQLPPDLRGRVRDTIARQCREVYEASLDNRAGGTIAFQQNHFWFAHLSLILGAAAVYGEVPEAADWLAWAWDRVERIFLTFSPDGGFHEGPGYWDYSMPTLYLIVDLYEWCTGLAIPAGNTGLAGQAQFRFYHLYPGFDLTAALEDTSTDAARPPVKLFLWQARRFKDPLVMGLAELLRQDATTDRFALLWLDDELVPEAPLVKLPLARRYPDLETVFARSSWEPTATSFALVSRPLGGHLWADLCDRYALGGTGHQHPAQGHFILYGHGEVLAADPGYTYKKETRNHNTILVDGKGQFGDGEMWPRPTPGRAVITGLASEDDVTIVSANPLSAYPPDLGLIRFERTTAMAGPGLVVVCDRLASAEPRTFSWLLHHYGTLTSEAGRWRIVRRDAQLTVIPLLPPAPTASTETYRPQYIHPTRNLTPKTDPDIGLLELRSSAATEMTFLVALCVGGVDEQPPPVQPVGGPGWDGVRSGDTLIAFRRPATSTMDLPLPWGRTEPTEATAVIARVKTGQRQLVRLGPLLTP